MKVYIVVASINELANIVQLLSNKPMSIEPDEIKIIVVDEGNTSVRRKNYQLLSNFQCNFYGPKERQQWFKQRFGTSYEKFMSVIPQRCHAETSFGFLVAYEEEADIVIELDDDVFPATATPSNVVEEHLHQLLIDDGVEVRSQSKWYNVFENLVLTTSHQGLFPRGYPYSQEARLEDYVWKDGGGRCVLNMGLWTGHPDLDALTILYHGGLDGRCHIKSKGLKREKVVVGKGTYFPICSMNTSFASKVIPAFYQLYMNHMGVDRFDDIWSGVFLKKIADHLGDKICIGKPLVRHDKRPRNIFRDLRMELEGMAINEVLWKIVDAIELTGKDYHECYLELSEGIERHLDRFNERSHKDFIALQAKKMKLWLRVVEKLR